MHDLIVEDEQDTYHGNVDVNYNYIDEEISNMDISGGVPLDFATYLQTK